MQSGGAAEKTPLETAESGKARCDGYHIGQTEGFRFDRLGFRRDRLGRRHKNAPGAVAPLIPSFPEGSTRE